MIINWFQSRIGIAGDFYGLASKASRVRYYTLSFSPGSGLLGISTWVTWTAPRVVFTLCFSPGSGLLGISTHIPRPRLMLQQSAFQSRIGIAGDFYAMMQD